MTTTTPPHPRTPSAPQAVPAIEERVFQLEKRRFRLEKIALAAVIVSLLATAAGLYAAKASVDAATKQLYESQYESVYGMQLDLWQLAAEHPELAPYIVGEKKPEPVDKGMKDKVALARAESKRASQDAAISNALDFYAYIFSQYAPRDDDGNVPQDALQPRERPESMAPDEWVSWQTWAATILTGFDGAPGMCDQLREFHELSPGNGGNYACEDAFADAVHAAKPDCV